MTDVVKFSKVVGEGKALGYLDGRACFVAGPLPGESARVTVTRSTARFVEAELVELVSTSERRQAATEAHFGHCSPWQGVDYDYQLELKRGMLAETMGRPELALTVAEMVAAPKALGYRNKLEFVLEKGSDERLRLAFHARRRADKLVTCAEGCVLGSAAMNAVAVGLAERLTILGIGEAAHSIMVRESHSTGQYLGVVGLRRRMHKDWRQLMAPPLSGVVVAEIQPPHSYTPLWTQGDLELVERVGGVDVAYSYGSFFQTNVAVFEQALERIMAAVPRGARVVDLYGGAGAIGLPVAAQRQARVTGVEIDPAAVRQANATAAKMGLADYIAVATPAERLDPALLAGAEVVIVDPPRAGLDRRVVEALLAAAPRRIIYLSCNPVTQARDLMRLAPDYRGQAVTGFDFYPGTLHLESLVVLDRVADGLIL